MYASMLNDVSIPLFAVGIQVVIYILYVGVIETVAMALLKWGIFWRCLWISFLMNITSTIIGLLLAKPILGDSINLSIWMIITFAFLLSILIEAGVLMLVKRGAARQNWLVSIVANFASYLLIIVPLAWLRGI